MKKILIVKLTAIGDIIHLSWILPALRVLYPGGIDWAVDSRYKKFLELFSDIDHVIPLGMGLKDFSRNVFSGLSELGRQVRRLRLSRYDAVVDTQGLLKSGIVTGLSRSPRKIGFAKPEAREGSNYFYHIHNPQAQKEINVVDKYLSLFKEVGVTEFKTTPPALNLSKIDDRKMNDFLKGIPGSKIVLNPSSSFYTKNFPVEQIPPLAEYLNQTLGSPLIVMNNGEMEFEKLFTHPHIRMCPRFSLEELPAFLNRCDFLIGVDSGPSYIAELVGLPSLILFGPTNRERQSPTCSRDPYLQQIFQPGGVIRHRSVYSDYRCPIIKAGEIRTPYRCLNRWCDNNLCMKGYTPQALVSPIQDYFSSAGKTLPSKFQ